MDNRFDIGKLPANWTVRSLRTCLRFDPRYGINAAAVPFEDSLPTYLRITDISEDNRFRPSAKVSIDHPDAPAFLLAEGDLVFARTGATVGKSYLYRPEDGPLVFAGFLIRISPNPEILHPAFLSYCAQSQRYWDWVARTSARSGQPGINGQEYGEFLLLLPGLDEQLVIAHILSDMDGLLQALETLIIKKRAVKEAAIQQLLTGKTRLPGFDEDWEETRFGDTCTFLSTANNPRADLEEHGAVGYVHYGDIHAHPLPVLNCASHDLPRIEEDRVGNAARLRDGDLVMVDASEDLEGLGKSVEVMRIGSDNVVAGLHTILCRGDSDHWAAGFKAYLQYIPAFKSVLTRVGTGISVYAVSKRQLASIVLALPSPLEQAAIVSVLSDMDAEIDALERRRDKARALKEGMMQQLLTGRVRLATTE